MSKQGEEEPTAMPGSSRGNFWRGFLSFGPAIVVCSLPGPAAAANGGLVLFYLSVLWYVGVVLWIVALYRLLDAYEEGESSTGTGILAALGVGLLALSVSCFAFLNLPGGHRGERTI